MEQGLGQAPTSHDCAELLRPLRTLIGLRASAVQWSDHRQHEQSGPVPAAAASLLAEIVHRGECRVTALAHHRIVDASVVSRQVAQLEQAQLISRRADPTDRRGCLVCATEAGRSEHRRLEDAKARWLSHALGEWSEEDLGALVGLLTRAADDIHRYAHAPPAQEGTG